METWTRSHFLWPLALCMRHVVSTHHSVRTVRDVGARVPAIGEARTIARYLELSLGLLTEFRAASGLGDTVTLVTAQILRPHFHIQHRWGHGLCKKNPKISNLNNHEAQDRVVVHCIAQNCMVEKNFALTLRSGVIVPGIQAAPQTRRIFAGPIALFSHGIEDKAPRTPDDIGPDSETFDVKTAVGCAVIATAAGAEIGPITQKFPVVQFSWNKTFSKSQT